MAYLNFAMKEKRRGRKTQMQTDGADCLFPYCSRTLQDYRDRKVIPYTQFAGKILYRLSDLQRILNENYRR